MQNNKLDYPLACHILRLQDYTDFFDLTEIVLFEYFVVKGQSFKHKQFYYSIQRISGEIKLKRDKLEKIFNRFEKIGIVNIELKGLPRTRHFIVDFEQIYTLLPQIYQLGENTKLRGENTKLRPFFTQLMGDFRKHKELLKESLTEPFKEPLRNEKEPNIVGETPTVCVSSFSNENNHPEQTKKTPAELKAELKAEKESERLRKEAEREKQQQERQKNNTVKSLKNLLNETYSSRVENFNRRQAKGERIKQTTGLPFLKRNEDALYELSKQYDSGDIENAFIAFIDEILAGNSEATRIISYFLSRKPKTQDFDTFATFLNKYAMEYGRTKN